MEKPKIFNTAQEAYSYLFISLQEQGIDIETASERAFKFSSEYAERMQIPTKNETKEKGLKGILQELKVASEFLKENPTIVEIGLPIVKGAGAAILGALVGTKTADVVNNNTETIESIVYENEQQPIIIEDGL